ncbi:Uncharacterized conserved protein, heparinase superfamily [Desulfacinum hydrothermale DSM 13146]|uniref:Uncharacterized conserved protein, heparinase superfamily n=1 Tax=Desulfacinum hydrothermale DSM 13146 TaxID=1121390 RepID=A0A1W1XS89_9BACT|nr:heparinase II/III family protein [Desulfacinum hydrothermale]SMC26715.1 Uncharacterized conserved protein, heparinase superfamily [Desulfacinum hydrothermale DSM 13146]
MRPTIHHLGRTVRTLAHYRPEQILYKTWFLLRARYPGIVGPCVPKVPNRPAWNPLPRVVPFPPNPHVQWSGLCQGRFTFLNRTRVLGHPVRWRPEDVDRLWVYNLHYFDFLAPVARQSVAEARRLMEHWIACNPPGTPDAWDPYPLSLRIVNWIKALSETTSLGRDDGTVLPSLYRQCLWLERSLEKHLRANHLFRNFKALVFAGLFFHTRDAQRWLEKGMEGLDEQLSEQILDDGGHFERSPMYHAMILGDCLDLLNALQAAPMVSARQGAARRERLTTTVAAMGRFLSAMTHPDGGVALFNDAAHGVEPDPADLETYARRLTGRAFPPVQTPVAAFGQSGYFVMAPQPGERLLVDCGRVGPDYQPGHSHCDTLSFELSLGGRRLIVDSGTYAYRDGPMRRYNRGNAGHNTVTIDGENQSQVWGAHRCGRRAKPLYARAWSGEDGALVFEGAHDGYRHLQGAPIHHRRVVWHRGEIRIEDRVEGRGQHHVESRLHIHPDLEVHRDGPAIVVKEAGRRIAVLVSLCPAPVHVEQGWYCPEFGLRLECPVVVTRWKGRLPYDGGWIIRKR